MGCGMAAVPGAPRPWSQTPGAAHREEARPLAAREAPLRVPGRTVPLPLPEPRVVPELQLGSRAGIPSSSGLGLAAARRMEGPRCPIAREPGQPRSRPLTFGTHGGDRRPSEWGSRLLLLHEDKPGTGGL